MGQSFFKNLVMAGCALVGFGILPQKISAAPDPNFHIYIAFGQSNMAGASPAQEPETKPYPRFKLLPSMDCPDKGRTMGVWTDATSQLANCDNPPSISVADYFGRTMVDSLPDVT
ncbi:MAG: acetyl xylan esterase, partial [Fibrobacteraceae bacterium]|nr:acetyl xylan esterase [Fibrobacteraceae bacterium]